MKKAIISVLSVFIVPSAAACSNTGKLSGPPADTSFNNGEVIVEPEVSVAEDTAGDTEGVSTAEDITGDTGGVSAAGDTTGDTEGISAAGDTTGDTKGISAAEDITGDTEEASGAENTAAEEAAGNRDGNVPAQYEIGDIILADGSIVKEADLTAIDSGNVPIAVIAGAQEDGTIFIVGVHRSDMPLQWASDDSAGFAAGFADIVCTQESEFHFSGDMDGRDNWAAVCAQDTEDTVDAAANYPAFHFVNTYAENYNLSGDYLFGWYMPSIAELCDIYQNRETINNSLRHIHGLDDQAAMNGLETNWYWSSSQAGTEDDHAWFVHYFNGYAGECPKNFTNVHTLAVHEFVVQVF